MMKQRLMFSIILLLVISVGLTGCEPLRKKFTRKKKAKTEDTSFIPVLEPQEYPEASENPVENYKQHYVLVQVFYKELWRGLTENMSEKNIKFNMEQVINHLAEMKAMLKADKQADIVKLEGLLSYYQETLKADAAFRNKSRVESDLREFHRQLVKCRADRLDGAFIDRVAHE